MIQAKKLNILVLASIFAVICTVFGLQQIFAATGNLYVSPSSSTVQIGNNLTVSVRLTPGVGVDSVDTSLAYDASKLEFVNVDGTGSGFNTELGAPTGGNGSVVIRRGSFSGAVTADSLIAKVSFKVLADSGTTAININGNATAFGTGTYTDPSKSGATVTLTKPPVTPPPVTPPPTEPTKPTATPTTPTQNSGTGSTGSDKPSTTNPDTPNSGNPGSSEKPKVEVEQSTIQFTKAGLVVKSSVAVKVHIMYGLDGALNLQSPQTELGQTHKIALDEQLIIPGSNYSYKIVSEDAAGNKAESPVQSFKTKGYALRVTIIGKDSQPLKKKKVTIFSEPQTGQTDGNGTVTFTNLPAGNHTVQYEQSGKQYKKTVLVDDIVTTDDSGVQVAALQNTAVLYEDLIVPKGVNTLGLTAVLTAIMLALAVFVLYKKGLLKPMQRQTETTVGPKTVYGDDEQAQPAQDIFSQEYPKVPAPGATIQPRNGDNDNK